MRSLLTLITASLLFAALGCSTASKQESTDDLSALSADTSSVEAINDTELESDSSLSEDLLSGSDMSGSETESSSSSSFYEPSSYEPSDASLGASSSGLGN